MSGHTLSLPDTLGPVFDKALQHYLDFVAQAPSLEAKDFTAYHNACKAALAHLMLLEKLIKQVPQDFSNDNLFDLLAQAKQENENVSFTPDDFT